LRQRGLGWTKEQKFKIEDKIWSHGAHDVAAFKVEEKHHPGCLPCLSTVFFWTLFALN